VHRRTLILGGIAISCATASRAAAWTLVTKEELARDLAAPHLEKSNATIQPGAPMIEVEQPDETRPIKPPVTIRLRFLPQGNSKIELTSFRATYGWLALDITKRILEHAELKESGLIANNADISPGNYKITLQIADDLHRVGSRDFEFTVV